jgi:hypothetical protein
LGGPIRGCIGRILRRLRGVIPDGPRPVRDRAGLTLRGADGCAGQGLRVGVSTFAGRLKYVSSSATVGGKSLLE